MALGEAVLKIQANVQGLIGGLNQAGAKMKKFGKDVGKVGKAISGAGLKMVGFGAAILAAFAPAVLQGAKFEQSMANVNSVMSDASDIAADGEQNFKKLTDTAKHLGATTEYSASQVADAMQYMGMAGMSTEEVLEGVGGVLQLATAGSLDLARASDIATDTMSAFNITAKDLSRVNDVLVVTQKSANTNVEMLGESFKYVAPLAAGLGQTIEDTSVMLGLLADRGIKASQAGTSLNQAMATLATPTQKLTDVLAKNGLTFDQVNASQHSMLDIIETLKKSGMTASDMIEAFGKRGGRAILSLVQTTTDKLNILRGNIENSFGEALITQQKKLNTVTGDFKQLSSAIEGLNIEIFEQLRESLRGVITVATNVVRSIHNFMKENEALTQVIMQVVAGIGGLSIAIGGILLVLGPLVSSIAFFSSTMGGAFLTAMTAAAGVLVSVKAAFVALIALGIGAFVALLLSQWEKVGKVLGQVYDAAIAPIVEQVKALFAGIVDAVRPVVDRVVEAFGYMLDQISNLFSAIQPVIDLLAPVRQFIAYIIGFITGGVLDILLLGLEGIFTVVGLVFDGFSRLAYLLQGEWTKATETAAQRTNRLAAEARAAAAEAARYASAVRATLPAWDAYIKKTGKGITQDQQLVSSLERLNELTPLEIKNLKDVIEQRGVSIEKRKTEIKEIDQNIEALETSLGSLKRESDEYKEVKARIDVLKTARKQHADQVTRLEDSLTKLVEKYGSLDAAIDQATSKSEKQKIKQDALEKSAKTLADNTEKLRDMEKQLTAERVGAIGGYEGEIAAINNLAMERQDLLNSQIEALELEAQYAEVTEERQKGIDNEINALNNLKAATEANRQALEAEILAKKESAIASFELTQEIRAMEDEARRLESSGEEGDAERAAEIRLNIAKRRIEQERQAELDKIHELYLADIEQAQQAADLKHEIEVRKIQANMLLSDEQKEAQIANLNAMHNAEMDVLNERHDAYEQEAQAAQERTDEHFDQLQTEEQAAHDEHMANKEEEKEKDNEVTDQKVENVQKVKTEQTRTNNVLQHQQGIESTLVGEMAKRAQTARDFGLIMQMVNQKRLHDEQMVQQAQGEVSKAEMRVARLRERLANAKTDDERKRLENQLKVAEDQLNFANGRLNNRADSIGMIIEDEEVQANEEGVAELEQLDTRLQNVSDTMTTTLDAIKTKFSTAGTESAQAFIDAWVAKYPEIEMAFLGEEGTGLRGLNTMIAASLDGIIASFRSFTDSLAEVVVQMQEKANMAMAAAANFAQAQTQMGGGGMMGGGGNTTNNQTINNYGPGGNRGGHGNYQGA